MPAHLVTRTATMYQQLIAGLQTAVPKSLSVSDLVSPDLVY